MMYQWKSEYLEEYAQGYIIVEANSVAGARIKALKFFDEYDRESYSWNYGRDQDEDDKKEILERYETFTRDISDEPKVSEVIFIRGSE